MNILQYFDLILDYRHNLQSGHHGSIKRLN